jgi:hypothetical protein
MREFADQKALQVYVKLHDLVYLWEGTRPFSMRFAQLSPEQREVVHVRTKRGVTRALLFRKALLRAETGKRRAVKYTERVQYLSGHAATPAPPGWILAHNDAPHAAETHSGMQGFRAWLARPAPHYVECPCGWGPRLGTHYRVERSVGG